METSDAAFEAVLLQARDLHGLVSRWATQQQMDPLDLAWSLGLVLFAVRQGCQLPDRSMEVITSMILSDLQVQPPHAYN